MGGPHPISWRLKRKTDIFPEKEKFCLETVNTEILPKFSAFPIDFELANPYSCISQFFKNEYLMCVCVCFLFFWSTQTDTRSRLLAFETFCSWLSLIYKIKKEKWEKRNMHSNVVVCSVMSDSLQSHELQHARPPCPSPSPWVCSNSCPLSWWFHPTISSSVASFSSCPQSFPASGSFQMSQLFASGGQSIELVVLDIP